MRQGAGAIVVRLGSLEGGSQAQLDGFKSRALRARAPTQCHQHLTEWRALGIAAEQFGALLVLATEASSITARQHPRLQVSLYELAAYTNSNMCMAPAIVLQALCEYSKPSPLCKLETALASMQMCSRNVPTIVWLLTNGAGLSGLARSARAEVLLPVHCIDGATTIASGQRAMLAEHEAALRPAVLLVPRLAHAHQWKHAPLATAASTHLVTGGTGGLGLLTARWLAQHHAVRALAIASRSGMLASVVDHEMAALHAIDTCRLMWRCDAVEDAHMRQMVARTDGWAPTCVWHAAGVLADGILAGQNAQGFTRVYGPKAHGAQTLHCACATAVVAVHALFSSVAALLGSAGQANYSAANACLDALVAQRRSDAIAAASVQWGAWAEVGMAARGAAAERMAAMEAASGFGRIGLAQGLGALHAAVLAQAPPVSSLIPVQWDRMLGNDGAPAFLSSMSSTVRTRTSAVLVEPGAMCAISLETVLDMVRRTAGGSVDADAPLIEAGVDSLGAVELRNQLQRAVGDSISLSSTLMFDHPTGRQVATHLGGSAVVAVETMTSPAHLTSAGTHVDIAGTAVSLPMGGSALREVSHCACDLLCVIPSSRWDVEAAGQDLVGSPAAVASRVRHGGFLRDAELFDHGFFSISAAEAAAMDPQQRQLLEHGYSALHMAGRLKASLLRDVIAVNVGQWQSEFGGVLLGTPAGRSVYALTGFSCSVTCGRVSFVLGLQGPCASYDTACSASLVANHGSMRALQCRECRSALSAGVNMILDPATMRGNAVAGFTSVRGRSHTFDACADGYARGEAIGTVVSSLREVKVGSDTEMRGSAVQQDGRSASLTAPNGQAQQGVLGASLADAQAEAGEVATLEAHGTGTALGDPIEAGAVAAIFLARVFGMGQSLCVGSLKANAGHTEPGAGVAGILKLQMQLQEAHMSPNAHLQVLNTHVGVALQVDAASVLPVQVSSRMLPGMRLGGVSSFGYAGTISHTLLAFGLVGDGQAVSSGYGKEDGAGNREVMELPNAITFASGADPPTGRVFEKCLRYEAERLYFACHSQLPLSYCRRAFLWCDVASHFYTHTVRMYSLCWAASPSIAIASRVLWTLLACMIVRNEAASPPVSNALTVLIDADAPTAFPSLHGTRLGLALVQRLAGGMTAPPRLLVLTCGAFASLGVRAAAAAAHGSAWGFARVLRLEHPGLCTQSADASAGSRALTTLELIAPSEEAEAAWRGSACFAVRLRACEASFLRRGLLARGMFALTGGLGGLGVRAAELLVNGGAGAVLLASRSGRASRDGQGLESKLQSLSSVAVAVVCDSADAVDASALLALRSLTGLLHAAGKGDKGLLVDLEAHRLRWMHASKAAGAWHLQCASAYVPLGVCVLFSSIGSGLGNVGQASYAAANACLDAHASSLRARGSAACSMQWPLVGGAGMGAATFAAVCERQIAFAGLAGVSLEEYAICLGSQLACNVGVALSVQMVHRSDARRLLEDVADASQPRFVELVPHTERGCVEPVMLTATTLLRSGVTRLLATATPSQRRAHIDSLLLHIMRDLTGTPSAALAAETPLMEVGVDSLAATELASRLRALTGMALSPTLVFEQPTPRAIASHLVEQLAYEACGADGAPPHENCATAPPVCTSLAGCRPGCCGDSVAYMQAACSNELGSVPQTWWAPKQAVETCELRVAQTACEDHSGLVSRAQCLNAHPFGLSTAATSANKPLTLALGPTLVIASCGSLYRTPDDDLSASASVRALSSFPKPGTSLWGADVAGWSVNELPKASALACLQQQSKQARFVRSQQMPLCYRRWSFLWREAGSASDTGRTRMYTICWNPLALIAVCQTVPWMLLAHSTTHKERGSVPSQHAVVTLFEASSSAAPLLRDARLTLALTQWLAGNARTPSRMLILTCGVLASDGGPAASDAMHGGVWGFARVVRSEHPLLRMQSVDISPHGTCAMAPLAPTLLPMPEAEVVWSGIMCLAARLRVCRSPTATGEELMCGLYTLTGGIGNLGLRSAALLVERGASLVLLASRSGFVAGSAAIRQAQLRSSCTIAALATCDTSDCQETTALLSGITFSGVLHAAGIIRDRMLLFMPADECEIVFASKATAAWHVQRSMIIRPLDAVGLFSSVSALFGTVGQANYAAANSYLDVLARCRSLLGTPCSSLQIPPVRGFTMKAFGAEQLDAMGAISLEEFATSLCTSLMMVCAVRERVQVPIFDEFAYGSRLLQERSDTCDSKPAALWRHSTLRERQDCSQEAMCALDIVLRNARSSLPVAKDVVVVGAGLTGISVTTQFIAAGVDIALLEKSIKAGGVWRLHGNAFSRVNSTEPGYRLRLKRRSASNSNHSHCHEILRDVKLVFEQFSLVDVTFPEVELLAVARGSTPSAWRLRYVWRCSTSAFMTCTWAILCTNRRLGLPRSLVIADSQCFRGEIRRGISNDTLDVAWKQQHVLILGHGPYATENARTALEHAAARVTFAVRRHGIVCPELVDYVNYIRDYDSNFDHPAGGSALIFAAWREMYRVSNAKPPEVWSSGRILPDGHAVN